MGRKAYLTEEEKSSNRKDKDKKSFSIRLEDDIKSLFDEFIGTKSRNQVINGMILSNADFKKFRLSKKTTF